MAVYHSPQYPDWALGYEIDHVGTARQHLLSMFPEGDVAPSSVEATVIEALASMIGPIAMAFQVAPSRVVEHLMGLYGLFRIDGAKAIGKARFRVSTSVPEVTIHEGTIVRYVPSGDVRALDFRVVETITIYTENAADVEVEIEAMENGTVYNNVPAGVALDTVDYMIAVESVSLSERTHDGEDAETTDSFMIRAENMLSRQTTSIVYAEQLESVAKTRPEVGQAMVLNNYDAATGTTKTGHITVALTGRSGLPLLSETAESIWYELQSQVLASLVIHVIDPHYTTVNLTVTVEALPGTNHAQVQEAVQRVLVDRLDPKTWNWWNTITNLDIASWIDEVAGVARVVSAPNGITLTGVAPLPRAGDITVNVNPSTR